MVAVDSTRPSEAIEDYARRSTCSNAAPRDAKSV